MLISSLSCCHTRHSIQKHTWFFSDNAVQKGKFYSQQILILLENIKTEDTPGTAVLLSWVQLVQGKPQRTQENQYSSTHQDTKVRWCVVYYFHCQKQQTKDIVYIIQLVWNWKPDSEFSTSSILVMLSVWPWALGSLETQTNHIFPHCL